MKKNSEINKDSNNQNFFHGKFFIPSTLKPGDITTAKLSKNSKKNNIKIKRNLMSAVFLLSAGKASHMKPRIRIDLIILIFNYKY